MTLGQALPAVGAAGNQVASGRNRLEVTAPEQTNRGSVVLKGKAWQPSTVQVDGGMAPVTTLTAPDGTFSVEVTLRPAAQNHLRLTASAAGETASAEVRVWQVLDEPNGQVSGRVRELETGMPLAGATVSYGPRTAFTDAAGQYVLVGVPDGHVVVTVRSFCRLTRLVTAEVAAGRGLADDALLQAFAPPVLVGPSGGSFSGPGWEVEVPPGAVGVPTQLNLTTLAPGGLLDEFGAPVLDLSPTGLRFAVPITVTVDPTLLDLDPSRTSVVTVDPDTAELTMREARVEGQRLRFELTDLAGVEVRLAPVVGPRNQWGGIESFCTPFDTPADADRAVRYLRRWLLPYLNTHMGPASRDLYAQFLAGGVATTTPQHVTDADALEEFRTAAKTDAAVEDLFDDLLRAIRVLGPPELGPPDMPTTRAFSDYQVGEDVLINWNYPFDVPGNIAGNVGEVVIDGVRFPDRRDFSGPIRFIPEATDRGVLTEVMIRAELTLKVQDAIDFCPGDAGGGIELNATIPLSRLEVTPLASGGFHGKKIRFDVELNFPPDDDDYSRDVTDLFPTNDKDDDGVPDRQPWSGASFTLDNCPDVSNEDQADEDGDGVGDACDEEEDEPEPPASGGVMGDPHFFSFDSGYFDFQATGEYVLAKSTTDDFEVHGRFARREGLETVSLNHGVAARVGSSIIAFGDDTEGSFRAPRRATLDGQPIPLEPGQLALPGGAVLIVDANHQPTVRWPDGTELAPPTWFGAGTSLRLAQGRWGAVHGLLGNANGSPEDDVASRNGVVVANVYDRQQLYGVFGPSWRTEGPGSFFRTPLTPELALPVVPPAVATIGDLSTDAQANAERVCRARGLLPGAGLEQCILDVGFTGDEQFADYAAWAAVRLRSSVDLGPLGAPVEDTRAIQLGRRESGSLDTALAADLYTVTLQAGSTVRISTTSTCPGRGTFSITLIAPGGDPIGRTHGNGCGSLAVTRLRETGRYELRVFDAGGFTGPYAFQVDAEQVGLTCQATEVAPNDDGSGPEVPLPFTVNFFGRQFSSLWVNNNGNVTFDGPFSSYTPEPLGQMLSPIVAAWFADVDTRGSGSQPVRYGFGSVDGRRAFCVDSDRVGYFDSHDDRLNSFQLFIVDRADVADGAFDIVLRYRQLQWETGDASGGVGGLGGTAAGVGYSNGSSQPGTFFELQGSRQPGAFLDSSPGALSRRSTNSTEPGVHVFPVRP